MATNKFKYLINKTMINSTKKTTLKHFIHKSLVSCFLMILCLVNAYYNGESEINSKNVKLGDIQLHYKFAGKGTPIIFLHGGTSSSESWINYMNRFSDSYRVIAPDCRGQGKSSIGISPITYSKMANDIVKLMDYLVIDKFHIVGQSDGGVISIHLLTEYPERILSATLIGTPYHINNYPKYVQKTLETYTEDLKSKKTRYKDIKSKHLASKNQQKWTKLVNLLGEMWKTQPTFSESEIKQILTPVLIVKTDNDYFIPSKVFDKMSMLIKGAKVLYIPEGNHSVYKQKPEEISNSIRIFIQETENEYN